MRADQLEQRGQHFYAKATGAGPYELRQCRRCDQDFYGRITPGKPTHGRYCSTRCSRLGRGHASGEHNPTWKGDDVTYVSAHFRVYRTRGKASGCVWGCIDVARYEWANLTGALANPDDYVGMCARCHRRFDREVRLMLGVTRLSDAQLAA